MLTRPARAGLLPTASPVLAALEAQAGPSTKRCCWQECALPAERAAHSLVHQDEHRPVHNEQPAGGMAGRQGLVARDHDQLVAAVPQHLQSRG